MILNFFKRNTAPILFATFLTLFVTGSVTAQVRTGVGFLKLTPGARESGMAGASTGNLDLTEAFYVNPGTTGLLREWQWSATYTRWISDVYLASFLYGKNLRLPWSRFTRAVLGFNYLGVPNFDNTNGVFPAASGGDLLITASVGQPLGFISHNLAFGGNFKYLRSDLAEFAADALMADIGFLYRTAQLPINFSKGILDYAVVSAGVSVTNIGGSVEFIAEGTPLPRTLRAGAALNLGRHRGLQLNFSGDYKKIRDEDAFFILGSEISWRQLISLRLGYSFEDNLLGHYSFGTSFRFDSQFELTKAFAPGRNDAIRLDFATNQNSDFTSAPFHGSITHFPIGPEDFRILSPVYDTQVDSDTLRFQWEQTSDRDLFDKTRYWLLASQDSLKMNKVLQIAARDTDELFRFLNEDDTFEINQPLESTGVNWQALDAGNHHWAVFAYDTDRHVRFGTIKKDKIGRFYVKEPLLEITSINFDYSPLLSEDDYQGIIKVEVKNAGDRVVRDITLSVFDSTAEFFTSKFDEFPPPQSNFIASKTIADIQPGGSAAIDVEWHTNQPGQHFIRCDVAKINKNNPSLSFQTTQTGTFYTIPKGFITTKDTVLTQSITNINYELPYVGKVFFDSSSSEVPTQFVGNWIVEPLLRTLARRLQEHPDFKITLQGTADPNSGENAAALAEARALAVRDTLLNLGAAINQIEVLPGEVLESRRLSRAPKDTEWILQERRRVDIITDEIMERVLFRPTKVSFHERLVSPILFSVNVYGVVPLKSGMLHLTSDKTADSLALQSNFAGPDLAGELSWQIHHTDNPEDEKRWQDAMADYNLTVVDSLVRRFYAKPRKVFLQTNITNRERMYFGIAKFGLAEPLYNFYWDNLLERIPVLLESKSARLRFSGHACAIGSEPINQRLSEKRARIFHERFLADLKANHPDIFEMLQNRIDPPEGFGESTPFTFKNGKGESILLGDNELPAGRQLNRRIIALIYSEE